MQAFIRQLSPEVSGIEVPVTNSLCLFVHADSHLYPQLWQAFFILWLLLGQSMAMDAYSLHSTHCL